MASVTPRALSNGEIRWRVQARVDGKMQQATFLAEKGAREFGALVDRVGWHAAKTVLEARRMHSTMPTLREWTERYLDPTSGLLTGVESATRADYQQAAERSFLPVLGEMPVNAIEKADVGRWVAWQEAQPSRRGGTVSAKTVRNYHAILSATLQAAVQEKLRDSNPAHRTRMTRGTRREGVFLTADEYATLLYFIPDRYQPFIAFLAGTGARWGEATAVVWGDLNLNATPPTIRIERAWKKGIGGKPVLKQPKSSRSKRTVSLFDDLVAVLGTPGEQGSLIFPGRAGGHMWHSSFRTNVWEPSVKRAQDPALCARAGLAPLRKSPNVHDLRHSHASWLIAAGIPLPFVQARLGHESITTTVGTYGHLQPDAHVQLSTAIAQTLAGTRTLREVRPR